MPALDGLRILDMTLYEAGPSCTQMLAWLGADVVKLERPGSGDPGRAAPATAAPSDYFEAWNANKRSLALAVDEAPGRELLLRLIPRFDVFVENYSHGVVNKLGIDYETVRKANPRIIYAQIKGFGLTGPHSQYKCFDMIAQACSGMTSVTGEADGPPVKPAATVGDSGTGVQLALAIASAYIQVMRTGEGQHIEISMQEALTYFMRGIVSLRSRFGGVVPRLGNRFGGMVELLPCKPGGPNDYVNISMVTDRMWEALCRAIGAPELLDDARFRSTELRDQNADALWSRIGEWTRERDKFECMRVLCEAGVPAGAVQDTDDLFRDPHLQDRDFVQQIDHPKREPFELLGNPIRMSAGHPEISRAPLLGEHSEEILRQDLGLSDAELKLLRTRGIVGTSETA